MLAKKSPKRRRRFIMMLVVACVAVSIALSAASYWFVNIYPVYLVQEFGAEIYVGSIVGFNVDNDMLHFGIVAPSGEGARKMILYTEEHRTMVSIDSSGPIAEWISTSDNNFIMEPRSSKTLWVIAKVPENTTIPNYRNGTVRITFRKLLF